MGAIIHQLFSNQPSCTGRRLFIGLLLAILMSGYGTNAKADRDSPSSTNNTGSQLLIVLVYDKSCFALCQKVRPLIKELEQKYIGRVKYVELDSSAAALQESEKTARTLGVYSFLADSADWVPLVGLFNSRKKLVKELTGFKEREVYEAAIVRALAEK